MTDFGKFIKYILKSKLLILGFIIYLSFNISALWTHWYDYFFFGSSIHHCCQGLDFYQIPNAMYSFLHGGDLIGNLPNGIKPYSYPFVSNLNVYHPLITIVLGSFFILFDPTFSIKLWTILKIFMTVFAVYYIYKNFRGNKYLNLAIFLFLINFPQYNDIKISQFQFLFNISLLFFLIRLVKNNNMFESGILFFLTLISKPISLLWIPILLIKRKFLLTITGLCLFLISTLTFVILGVGQYYINNITYHLLSPIATKGIDFMSLDALLRNGFHLSNTFVRTMRLIFLGGIYILALNKKSNILISIFSLTVYFLLFYDLVFEYHFSVLGPLLSVCLLSVERFQTKIARALIIIINLPTIFFILRLFKIGSYNSPVLGVDPTLKGWEIVSLFQLLPIILLTIIVLIPDIKDLLKFSKNKNYVAS